MDTYDEYTGSKNDKGLPHGYGKNINKLSDGSINSIEEGKWQNGFLVEGSHTYFSQDKNFMFKKEIGKWRYDKEKNFCEEDLSGEGEELYFKNEVDLQNNKPFGYVKGIFDNGTLLKGEVYNAYKINYSDSSFVKQIKINGKSKRNSNPQGNSSSINLGEIFFENGDHYEGEIEFDMPQGRGTMKYKDGSKQTTTWVDGVPV